MKKLLLMIMLVAGINMLANAQTKMHKTPEQKAQHLTKMLNKKLVLTADQSVKVKAILFKRATQMDSLKANQSTTDRKMNRMTRKQIMMDADKEVNGVLTATQQKTYAEVKAAMKEKMKARKGAKTPAAAPAVQG
ncbi:hypothetical protein [Mucilaginibacter glaciei]|uniref:DUF4890 domain-containing protein n=1 Tax=Mucilaginibacter glaciei TaxID=2772109 RepID=A0A926S199_9SPHI|nr:hypothetical protein [Mucilaginibacter glaciei]MBD1392577.1 hypothetical protein [Mucilaginibacter glaciei]